MNPVNPADVSRRDLLALFSLLSLAALILGGWLTSLGFGTWYDELRKPPFQPPGWLFSPVWTTLFTLLAIATWRVARKGSIAQHALRVYAVQLILNVLWSLFFFTLHQPTWALLNIALLDALVVAMVILYGRIDRMAGWFLVPYAIWLGLATAINTWIVLNN
ncbi:tryptophan-rich sensory protein [Myxococcota bacterium]|nr:tryptophan-rich sensory protein [Myxococcota bacterium]